MTIIFLLAVAFNAVAGASAAMHGNWEGAVSLAFSLVAVSAMWIVTEIRDTHRR